MSTDTLLSRSRVSDTFEESELVTQTGQDKHEWGRYVAKELLDNALDYVDNVDNPSIRVELEEYDELSRILVRDNGVGISEEAIPRIFQDVDEYVGSKQNHCRPSRGNQGNALMTILGISYNCDRPLRVATQGTEYKITVTDNARDGTYDVDINDAGTLEVEGTLIEVNFGDMSMGYTKFSRVEGTVRKFMALNPHVDFTVEINGDEEEHPAKPDPTNTSLSLPKNANSGKATWFTLNQFMERIKAESNENPDLTTQKFVRQFCKLSSRSKWKDVKENFRTLYNGQDIPDTIGGFFKDNGEKNESAMTALHAAMKKETASYSSSVGDRIGKVGKDMEKGLLDYSDRGRDKPSDILEALQNEGEVDGFDDITELSVYKSDGAVLNADVDEELTRPFYFEVAAVPTDVVEKDGTPSSKVIFGINQSISYSPPSFGYSNRLGVEYKNDRVEKCTNISRAFNELGHDFTVICNLTCPNIDFKDKGKQGFDESPYSDVIGETIGLAVRNIQNNKRPVLNKLRKPEPEEPELPSEEKAPSGFVRETILELFDDAYKKTTEDGKYTPRMRQLFYNMRPMFMERVDDSPYKYSMKASIDDKKPLKLRYSTFTDIVDQYEEEEAGERIIHRDPRGFFVEPHSNDRVNLGTGQVKDYTPDLDEYGSILLIEKKGFFDMLHKQFEISKRYDVGLINAQGMSTNACRDLIENIQSKADEEGHDVTLYTLTDLDISGVGIAYDARNPDELSTVDEFDTELLGLTLDAVEEYDLPAEPAGYDDDEITKLDTFQEEGRVDDDLYDFFTEGGGRRVEINALSPPQLKEYLETRFDEMGIEKVEPDKSDVETPDIDDTEETHENAIRQVIGGWLMDQSQEDVMNAFEGHDEFPSEKDLIDSLDDEDVARGDVAESIHDQITDDLGDFPPKGWQEMNEDIVDENEKKAEAVANSHESDVDDGLRPLLDEHVEITINIDSALK
jgi:DNA topoisomerase VI subunit B